MKRMLLAAVVAATTLGLGAFQANATVITLDFDTAATGSTIDTTPLVTSAGTITASASSGSTIFVAAAGGGFTGNGLGHDQGSNNNAAYAELAFDFDVASVTFEFVGLFSGEFSAQVLDASMTVLDSFFDTDTATDMPGGPVTLSGSGIRFFRFNDPDTGSTVSGVDNVVITTVMPEPGALTLFGVGLAGLGLARRRRRS